MKLAPQFIAASCLLVGASALWARQPAPHQDHLPAPLYLEGEPGSDLVTDDNVWSPPPVPHLPYGFTWDGYYGAHVEHDVYGDRRLYPPPRKTVSCYGLVTGLTDSVAVMFSYPTPHRPPPMYCPKGGGRCVPGKFSYGVRSHCNGGCCTCQSQPATIVYEPALSAPRPLPMPEPGPVPTFQPRLSPARPLIPPVLIDDSGLPPTPVVEAEEPAPAATAPMSPPPVLTEDPLLELPRNKIPARDR